MIKDILTGAAELAKAMGGGGLAFLIIGIGVLAYLAAILFRRDHVGIRVAVFLVLLVLICLGFYFAGKVVDTAPKGSADDQLSSVSEKATVTSAPEPAPGPAPIPAGQPEAKQKPKPSADTRQAAPSGQKSGEAQKPEPVPPPVPENRPDPNESMPRPGGGEAVNGVEPAPPEVRQAAVFFPRYSAEVSEEDRERLAALLEICLPGQTLLVRVEGHADQAEADTADLIELSRSRAEEIAKTLQELAGNQGEQGSCVLDVQVEAFGAQRPLVEHENAAGDPQNRRVDIRLERP
ncbi:OmpA family protein [Pedomonas mirosovicensis]|uniref:OmpA family protein n=1 Tax=Pedomonas mirosovicensis TaxID=2908641 RepID=UPI0021697D38|nr:OmpA family protein [Pedomonas mirosovicensis]MCH8685510.1 OmpA family protein [Pedomonas mirosovicensis]